MDLAERKRELRSEIAKLRRVTLLEERARLAGERFAERLVPRLVSEGVEILALYAALPSELATRPAFERARAAGLRCCLPRCEPGRQLAFHWVHEWESLRPGRYGVLEPGARADAVDLAARPSDSGVSGSKSGVSSPKVWVVVPGVAFDRRGGRLGRGAGYYDRSFEQRGPEAPILCGAGFSFQILDEVPTGDHDRRMDLLFDEFEIERVRQIQEVP